MMSEHVKNESSYGLSKIGKLWSKNGNGRTLCVVSTLDETIHCGI